MVEPHGSINEEVWDSKLELALSKWIVVIQDPGTFIDLVPIAQRQHQQVIMTTPNR